MDCVNTELSVGANGYLNDPTEGQDIDDMSSEHSAAGMEDPRGDHGLLGWMSSSRDASQRRSLSRDEANSKKKRNLDF